MRKFSFLFLFLLWSCSSHEEQKRTSVVTPNVGSLPFTLEGDVKVFHLVAEEVRREFSPGFWVNCWGYNGSTPGPTIEAVEGDRVKIIVTNRLPEATTVHWHGIILPNDMDGMSGLTQKPIPPGESFTYAFTLVQNGTFMYHPHYDEMTQVALGMEGFFIIHPKEDAHPVDHDFALFLHEWNVPIFAASPDPAANEFNLFTFNSALFPTLKTLDVKKGERVRVRFANLMMNNHPIHLHGYEFTVTRRGGRRLPKEAQYSEVTVSVAPGETRDIEFTADYVGNWAFHCHKSHHTMNQMVHGLPNLTGIDTGDLNQRIKRFFPDFTGLMNVEGMGHMFAMHGNKTLPGRSPIGTPGPFGVIELGGMFTILNVSE